MEGNDWGKAGNGSVDAEGSVDTEGEASAEAAGGSANEGKTSGSTDSCACAARTAAKKIPATKLTIRDRWAGRVIPSAVWCRNAAKRYVVKAMPEHMAARLDWRFKAVNKKMLLKFGQKKARI